MNKRYSQLFITLTFPMLLVMFLWLARQTQAGSPDVCASGCIYSSLQAALDDNDTVGTTLVLAAETFAENVEITRSITLVGAGPGMTIIDGQMTDTAVLISGSPTVSISELTIQNGDTTSVDGGGLLNEGGTVSLTNVVVQNNRAPNGAGITNDGVMILDNVTVRNNVADELVGDVSICADCAGGGIYNLSVMTITNSIIHGNMAKYGGGIDNAINSAISATNVEVYGNTAQNNPADPDSAGGGIENLGTLTLTNSTVRNNEAPFGAGIANDGTLTVTGSDIHNNVADMRGGGMHNSFNLTVQTSRIYDNEAGSGGGGGISSEGGDVIVAQTAVYNNSAAGSGGGIVHNVTAGANSFMLTNSTLSGNSASGTGGGLRNAGVAGTSLNNVTVRNNSAIVAAGQAVSIQAGTVSAQNSIISSQGTDCSGAISSNGYNIASDNSCGLSGTDDLTNADPQLGPLQDNGGNTFTHALLPGSPAIDSGSGCPTVDQRGVARPFGPACDRGAYEFDGESNAVYLPFVTRP